MSARLLLLTGPAAEEVANYLDDEETTERFEVRDYLHLTCGHTVITSSRRFLRFDCSTCRQAMDLPARLAILAPEPPPLLVERVRDWGGEVWECETWHEVEGPECALIARVIEVEDSDESCAFATWPEAVRAALGES